MTQNQNHQEKILKSLIQHGVLALAEQNIPRHGSAYGKEGVYNYLKNSYQLLGMNNELSDKMAKAIYHYSIRKLLDVESGIHYKGTGHDIFRSKKGSDILDLAINSELLQKHVDEIYHGDERDERYKYGYADYILSNIQKSGHSLDDLAISVSLKMQMTPQLAHSDRKPYQGQVALQYT